MSILILIVLVLVGLVALFFMIALFAKKGYVIERSVLISKPKQEVFNYVKLLKNQDHYSKWVMKDPGMKKEFRGTDGTEGFVYAWNSTDKNAGEGEMEIKKITEGARIYSEIRFERPMKTVSQAIMETESAGAQTNVKWSFISQMKYPFNALMVIVPLEKMLGKDMEESLALLKKNLEG
jgi:uncharacterized protein YndB with AHSA1/START domain